MTENEKHNADQTANEKKTGSKKKGICDSCNFIVDDWLGYDMILKFCEMHMKNNPGHIAAPRETNTK